MGRRVLTTVKENIFISLIAKLAVVLLTFGGSMTLFYAIASDVGIMLLVTLNGMKLLPSQNIDPRIFSSVRRKKRRQSRKRGDNLFDRYGSVEATDQRYSYENPIEYNSDDDNDLDVFTYGAEIV